MPQYLVLITCLTSNCDKTRKKDWFVVPREPFTLRYLIVTENELHRSEFFYSVWIHSNLHGGMFKFLDWYSVWRFSAGGCLHEILRDFDKKNSYFPFFQDVIVTHQLVTYLYSKNSGGDLEFIWIFDKNTWTEGTIWYTGIYCCCLIVCFFVYFPHHILSPVLLFFCTGSLSEASCHYVQIYHPDRV